MNHETPLEREQSLELLNRLLPPNAQYPKPAEIYARKAIARHRFERVENRANENGDKDEN